MDFEEITGESEQFKDWRKKHEEEKLKKQFDDSCFSCNKKPKRVFLVKEFHGKSAYPEVLEEHCDIVTAKKRILEYALDVTEIDKTVSQKELFLQFLNPEFIWPENINPNSLCYSLEEWDAIFANNGIKIINKGDLDRQIKHFLDKQDEIYDGENLAHCIEIREYEIIDGNEKIGNDFMQFSYVIEWKNSRLTAKFIRGHFEDGEIVGFEEFS